MCRDTVAEMARQPLQFSGCHVNKLSIHTIHFSHPLLDSISIPVLKLLLVERNMKTAHLTSKAFNTKGFNTRCSFRQSFTLPPSCFSYSHILINDEQVAYCKQDIQQTTTVRVISAAIAAWSTASVHVHQQNSVYGWLKLQGISAYSVCCYRSCFIPPDNL